MTSIREALSKPAPTPQQEKAELGQRILEAQELRLGLAKAQMNKLQSIVDHLQGQIKDLAEQNLPQEEMASLLRTAELRLDSAKHDFVRAQEAKNNTEHSIGEWAGEAKKSNRNALGTTGQKGQSAATLKLPAASAARVR